MCFSKTILIFVNIFKWKFMCRAFLARYKTLRTEQTMRIQNEFCKCIVNYLLFILFYYCVTSVFGEFIWHFRHWNIKTTNTSRQMVCRWKVKRKPFRDHISFTSLYEKKKQTKISIQNISLVLDTKITNAFKASDCATSEIVNLILIRAWPLHHIDLRQKKRQSRHNVRPKS